MTDFKDGKQIPLVIDKLQSKYVLIFVFLDVINRIRMVIIVSTYLKYKNRRSRAGIYTRELIYYDSKQNPSSIFFKVRPIFIMVNND